MSQPAVTPSPSPDVPEVELAQLVDPASPDESMVQNGAKCSIGEPNRSPSLTGDPAADPVDDGLSPQQRAAVALLIEGRTTRDVAARLGLHRNTIWRWRGQPAFAAELARLGREATDAAAARLRRFLLAATDVIDRSLKSRCGDEAVRSAFRVVTSKRVWDVANDLPPVTDDAGDDRPTA